MAATVRRPDDVAASRARRGAAINSPMPPAISVSKLPAR
jgi:hypothetical protein